MARYTGLFRVAVSISDLPGFLRELLTACNFEVIYETDEYMMGREIPGKIAFNKLVTVEVLIDRTTATDQQICMKFVLKNEELPLQVDNHCRKVFDQVNDAVSQSSHWNVLESAATSTSVAAGIVPEREAAQDA